MAGVFGNGLAQNRIGEASLNARKRRVLRGLQEWRRRLGWAAEASALTPGTLNADDSGEMPFQNELWLWKKLIFGPIVSTFHENAHFSLDFRCFSLAFRELLGYSAQRPEDLRRSSWRESVGRPRANRGGQTEEDKNKWQQSQ